MIGVILAGGKSTRFGSQKAFHVFEDKMFYQHIVSTMKQSDIFDEIVINTNDEIAQHFKDFSGNIIVDKRIYKDLGPLSGIYSVMDTVKSDSYFVVSVDTPLITVDALNKLAAVYRKSPERIAVYQDNEMIHPTIAIYPYAYKARIKQLLDAKQLRVRDLFDKETTYIDVTEVPGHWYININRPEDLAVLEEGD